MFDYDEFGPEKIINVYNPKTGMKGFIVIDNTAFGPGKGGIRLTPFVNVPHVRNLARTMTWKNALAELPFGGAKSGIFADDKKITRETKESIVRSFAAAIKQITPDIYIPAPDMYMGEQEMAWIADEIGDPRACTGKPKYMGGLPHELGSTGFGVYHAARVAMEFLNMDPQKTTFVVEGFGNVGQFVAKFLVKLGATLVGVSDSKGMILNQDGIDFDRLQSVKEETGSVIHYAPGKQDYLENIKYTKADVLITAARADLINHSDLDRVPHKLIVQGSNNPMKTEVEELFHQKGIMIIPDIIANAGGVISSYVEHIGGTEEEMFKLIEEKIVKNTQLLLEKSSQDKTFVRSAGMTIAKERVRERCKLCL